MRRKNWSYWRGVLIAYIMLFILIALSSCKTTRKVSEDYNLNDTLNINYGSSSAISISDKSISWLLDSLRTRTVFDIKIYDTTKNKDSLGYYPIAAEIHGETESVDIRKSGEQNGVTYTEVLNDSLAIVSGSDETYSRKETIKKTASIWSAIVSILAVAGSFLLIVLCIKVIINRIL